jgi:hypothetical protein
MATRLLALHNYSHPVRCSLLASPPPATLPSLR